MSVPAPKNNDQRPRGRGGVGGKRLGWYEVRPPKNELEFRHLHLQRATDDELTNSLYIRLRWHQTAMRLVLIVAGTIMPIGMILVLGRVGFSPEQIIHMFLIAGGGAGVGATVRWLVQRRGGDRTPGGSLPSSPDSGQAP